MSTMWEMVRFGVVGVITTVTNFLIFKLGRKVQLPLVAANSVAWLAAVLFAFAANKFIVFQSVDWNTMFVLEELARFLMSRLLTLLIETSLLWLLVKKRDLPEMASKCGVSVLVVLLNYLLGKFLVFAG